MTDRYVNPAVGSSGTGGSWAQAYKTLKEATDAAAAGEPIYFANGTADVITADTTYTLAAGVRIISTSDTTNNPPTTYATGATVSTTTTAVDVIVAGVGALFGVTFSLGDGTDTVSLSIGQGDASEIYAQDCVFTIGGSNAGGFISLGMNGVGETVITLRNCSFNWAATGQGLQLAGGVITLEGCDMSAGATHPSVLCEVIQRGTRAVFIGCDVSDSATTFAAAPAGAFSGVLSQCKLPSGGTIWAASAAGSGEVFVFDSAAGDSHIDMAHYTYRGSTVLSTSIYANDHIADSALSWVVAGTANTTAANPYRSPWLPVYHTGTSAITPYLECVRSGSSTAFTEAEVWSEWAAKVTSGSTRVTLYSNGTSASDPLDTTPSDNESSSKTGSDWTGENATSWFGKLQPNSTITPAEAGHISVRVCVGGNHTVYVDPQIRGLS